MRLSKVRITNFRSIADVTIDFETSCRVLVGVNESGKSNILKALSLLDKDTVPSDDDLRESLPDKAPIETGFVRFIFALDKGERAKAWQNIDSKVLVESKNEPLVETAGKLLSLTEYFETKTSTIYRVDLDDQTKRWTYYSDFASKVLDGWKKPKKDTDASVTFKGTKVPLSNYRLVHVNYGKDLPSEELEPISITEINAFINAAIHEVVKPVLPRCIYWEYKESNLLPGHIEIASFASAPESCLPMKYMFALAGYEDPKSAIEEAQRRPNGLRNLLKRVSELSTKHMHDVWKDYRGIRLQLLQNGDKIDAHIEDTYNVYNLARRSDGFKRFITFLLLVSAKARTKDLQNTLYLHDEPDISLHPSGARYLRDELIKISSDNYVVYSTHSIFMIDRNVINRHLIVEKKKEVTTISEVNESNIVDEEVIYNALGYSIFENLKPKNIIFEGWRDKRLFQYALQRLPSTHKSLRPSLTEIGVCHAKGVKDISRVSPMLELAARECVIISDGDKIAIEQQKKYDGYGKWLRYDELIDDDSVVTAEDFIKPEAFRPSITRIMSENPVLPDLLPEDLQAAKGRLSHIHRWLTTGGMDDETVRSKLNSLKEDLFSNLKPSQIEPKYFTFLEELVKKI